MKITHAALSVCVALASEMSPMEDGALSLLQTRARPITKDGETELMDEFANADVDDVDEDEYGADLDEFAAMEDDLDDEMDVEDEDDMVPPHKAARIAARRDARKQARAAGRLNPASYSPEKLQRIRSRRAEKRATRRAEKSAGSRSVGDGSGCEECTLSCDYLFQEAFKQCMIDENCQAWQKEDGPSSDKCKKRCDRNANWKREPCIRKCECSSSNLMPASLKQGSSKVESAFDEEEQWEAGIHRCRQVEVGQISTCQELALDEGSPQFDSIRKCALAAVEVGADTFNFFRSSKEWGKCSLRQCGGPNLMIADAPRPDIPMAGHGNWKVFSTHCSAPPPDQQSETGADASSR